MNSFFFGKGHQQENGSYNHGKVTTKSPEAIVCEFLPYNHKQSYAPAAVLSADTVIWYRKGADGIIEARQGFFVYSEELHKNKSNNPFDDDYEGNYFHGRGTTEEAALKVLKREYDNFAKAL